MNIIKLGILLLIITNSVSAGETGTFENFYVESNDYGWLSIILISISTVIAGIAIFFSGGTASPIAVSIGTYIGTLLGYSGAIATSTGLALLGGAAIITGALTFGTGIVVDYKMAQNTYDQEQFLKHSKEMLILPIPINKDGSKLYEGTLEILEQIDNKSLYSSNNQQVIHEAIYYIDQKIWSSFLSDEENIRINTLQALLYMLVNDYTKAKKLANYAIKQARRAMVKRTLPAFIYAISSLYESDVDIQKVTSNYFSYAILAEPDNKLIPLIFAVYMDRIMYRFNDGLANESHLRQLTDIAYVTSIKEHIFANLTLIIVRYFTRLKLEQQVISSLSKDMAVKDNPKILANIKKSFAAYNELLNGTFQISQSFLSLDMNQEEKQKAEEFLHLYNQYKNDKNRLENIIEEIEDYQIYNMQTSINHSQIIGQFQPEKQINYGLFVFIGIFIVLFCIIRTPLKKQH
ncbi:hypothetical protein QUF74_16105 [Candidatus Halobeggiatoa sp. HSG11]|nr:hypothetical protein [Candidatus Halobeggiatoa sp. HSG11]